MPLFNFNACFLSYFMFFSFVLSISDLFIRIFFRLKATSTYCGIYFGNLREKIKIALRLKITAFDSEIIGLFNACKDDLRLAGITINEDNQNDPLIERAVILYAKANFGYTDNAERYQKAYDYLKCSLSLSEEYIKNAVE